MHEQSNEKCIEKKYPVQACVKPIQIGAISSTRFIKKLALQFFAIAISRRCLSFFSQLNWKTVKTERIIVKATDACG